MAVSPIDVDIAISDSPGVKLLVEKHVGKRLSNLQPALRTAMLRRLKEIAAAPFANQANVTALRGEKDLFRLRHGDWRVVYRVSRAADEVRVLSLETRGSVYR